MVDVAGAGVSSVNATHITTHHIRGWWLTTSKGGHIVQGNAACMCLPSPRSLCLMRVGTRQCTVPVCAVASCIPTAAVPSVMGVALRVAPGAQHDARAGVARLSLSTGRSSGTPTTLSGHCPLQQLFSTKRDGTQTTQTMHQQPVQAHRSSTSGCALRGHRCTKTHPHAFLPEQDGLKCV